MISDAARVIRAAFPKWRTDPYQRSACNALLRILFAGENAERALGDVETALAFFIEDPPTSLSYAAPKAQAISAATRLRALAHELEKGAARLNDLDAYTDQFNPQITIERAGTNDGVREEAVDDSDTPF